MINMHVRFCNDLLRAVRADAKKEGVKFGKLTTWHGTISSWYEVYEDNRTVWSGISTCAEDAKYHYILVVLDLGD